MRKGAQEIRVLPQRRKASQHSQSSDEDNRGSRVLGQKSIVLLLLCCLTLCYFSR